jgi:MoxR-like ATPase
MASVPEVIVTEPLAQYAYRVVQATRNHESVALGVSPRAAMSWVRAARARALLLGRPYVLPDDLKALACPVLAHRVFLRGGEDATSLVNEVVAGVPVEL